MAEEVCELIYEIPVADFYSILKGAIFKRIGLSNQQPLDTLFTNNDIGDRKPSQLFRHMKQLFRSYKTDDSLATYVNKKTSFFNRRSFGILRKRSFDSQIN